MTDEHRRENIALEVTKARRELRHARLLMEAEGYDGAVSRAYYHALHFAQALLLCAGLEAKTHGGIAHLVNLHFVRSGRLAPEVARVLSRLQNDREDADYDAAAVFTRTMAEAAIGEAQRFGEAVETLLSGEGFLPPPT